MADSDNILEFLREKFARLETDIRQIKDDISILKSDVAATKRQLGEHARVLNVLQQDTRMIRAAVNDLARDNVTPGEIEAIHHDLNRVVRDLAGLTVRVEAIEAQHR